MRVNFEDSLTDDNHHRFMARALGWDEDRVLGKLYWVYRDTQRARFVTGTIDRAVTLCVLRFDSDDEARHFLNAMVSAQLAERKGEELRIKGNERRIAELDSWFEGKSKGGKASARKRQQIREQDSTESQQNATDVQQNPTVLSPKSFVLSPKSEEQNQIRDLPAPQAVTVTSKPKVVTESSPAFTRVVDCWFREHEEFYGTKPPWGALQGKQMVSIMRKAPGLELLDLIPQFFHGPYQDSIDAGHPLSDGFACLAKRVNMLRADLTKPERRISAARLRGAFREAERVVGVEDEMEKARRMLAADDQLRLLGDGNG